MPKKGLHMKQQNSQTRLSPRSPHSGSMKRRVVAKKDSNIGIPPIASGTEFTNPYETLPSDRQHYG